MLFHAEARRHSALALDAILERNAHQVALQVVGPCVIDAAEVLFAGAVIVEANQCAAMRAAVLESVDFAVAVAGDDHRSVTDESGAKIARIGYLGFKAEIIP